jgi:NTP pyrophosphatase (non-canonical NTP hydrolase)
LEAALENLEYQTLAEITESKDFEAIAKRISTIRGIRLLHAQLGIASEGGEISDQLKKHLFYGKPLDTVNIAEEIGDLFWYCALASNELGIDFASIMETNIAKLKARYGDKFSSHAALNRDLGKERSILEGNPCTECGHVFSKHFSTVMGTFCEDCPSENNVWEHVFRGEAL